MVVSLGRRARTAPLVNEGMLEAGEGGVQHGFLERTDNSVETSILKGRNVLCVDDSAGWERKGDADCMGGATGLARVFSSV